MPADVLWRPAADAVDRSRMGQFLTWAGDRSGQRFQGYGDLWAWSVSDLPAFWSAIWEFFAVTPETPARVLENPVLPGAVWFPGTALNYAEYALRPRGDGIAVLSRSQTNGPSELSWPDLRDQVARARRGLSRLGVGYGDRVAGYLPNGPEAVVAFLACASLGAVWSSCAPELGGRSVIDRLRQIGPKVLITVDGYRYGSRAVERHEEVEAIRTAVDTVEAVVVLDYLDPGSDHIPAACRWTELMAETGPLEFTAVPFDQPLYILYSSGTTGLPKPIVHGHGGILLEHLKALGLHADLGDADRFFWFTTTGWAMWNILVSGLLVGSGIVLFDGNPVEPDLLELWRQAQDTGTTYFGASASFLTACRKAALKPAAAVDLSAVRQVGSTGGPLPPDVFRWVTDELGPDVLLHSISGGTDVCTAFVGMAPLLPVWAGEMSCPYLGVRVEAFDDQGGVAVDTEGELVVSTPMPSMPVGFWGDPDGIRYREAYFNRFPGVWCHGDWILLTERGSCIISGRSDATLNRGGVRLGTAEFYAVIEELPEVADSLIIHLAPAAGRPDALLLFVVPADGVDLDDDLRGRIADRLRRSLSPRHVPDAIHAVASVPRTLSGKKLEVPVKRILTGMGRSDAASEQAMANPESLAVFERLARDRGRLDQLRGT